jgi:Coenzyme PQQ synthesis protein D (PqqD)
MSESCQNACYRKVPNVRVRGVPEMAVCLVFTPNDPEVYTLNPSAWLVLRLCDGRSEAKITLAYHAAVEPMLSRDEARREVRAGIESLIQKRIIKVVHRRRTRRNPTRQGGSS